VRHRWYPLATLAVAITIPSLFFWSGCGSQPAKAPAVGTALRITERDFKISAPSTAPAGELRLSVNNRGPVAHELIIVKAGRPRLPFRADGLTVDEDAVESRVAGALEPGSADRVRELKVRLKPGHYEMFCNMSGHYLAGMHRKLTVH
jgi:uncharacterized cupredoxin-like copper-binding protein